MSEDFHREDDMQFFAHTCLFEEEYTDDELGEFCFSQHHKHASLYVRHERAAKTDMEEKKLLINEVIIFVLCLHIVFL